MARIVLFANGVMTAPSLLKKRLRPDDRIFCVDGGTYHALALGLLPQAIIGDLDSLSPEVATQMKDRAVPIYRYPVRKDQTDLELGFQLAIAEKPEEILLVTALGGRLDQTLANVLLLTRPEYAVARLTLVDGPQSATLMRSHQTMVIKGQPGDTLSLVPLTPRVSEVSLTGVEWPLENATLALGSTWSISNALVSYEATARIGEGMVLVVHLERNYEEYLLNETD